MKERTSLICSLFGHKFEFDRVEQYYKEGTLWEKVFIVHRRVCARCGKHNPYYNAPIRCTGVTEATKKE